jgi:hypothetical protein
MIFLLIAAGMLIGSMVGGLLSLSVVHWILHYFLNKRAKA